MNMKGMDEEKVVKEIKKIIKNSYMFLGYDQFASLFKKHQPLMTASKIKFSDINL